jgi:uncharacterized protein (DUF58 family)
LHAVKLLWFLIYRLYCAISSVRYWGRRFTPAGYGILSAALVAALLGPDTENNVAYQAFTLLAGLLLVAFVVSWFFRARFSATRLLPRFGTVGAPLHYSVKLRNLSGKTQKGLALLESLADPRPAFAEWLAGTLAEDKQTRSFRFSHRPRTNWYRVATLRESTVPPVPAHEEIDVRAELTPLRRGVLRFKGVTLARPDPLGLFRSFATVPSLQTTLILPKRYPLPPIALPGTMKYQAGGIALASNVGQSDEFVALRDYRHGDPLRHIHWRSWAKAGKPVVREFEDEFFVRHALVLDTFSDHPRTDVFEEAVSIAASFAYSVRTQESLLDLLFVGPQSYCFTAGRGLARSDQMLEILASVQTCRDHHFLELEDLVLNHVNVVSGCICVLIAWDDERQKFVEKLVGLGVPVLVLVVVAAGHNETLEPGPMRENPNQFHVLEVGIIEAGLAELK